MSLFTGDTHFVVYMDAKATKPSQELHSREALAPVFADLNKYAATMHFVGHDGDVAVPELLVAAHHGELRAVGRPARLEVVPTVVWATTCWFEPSAFITQMSAEPAASLK